MDRLWSDLRHAARGLRHAPAFTTVAVATLALGIGATSAIFSVVQSVLLRPLPFPAPERIVAPISTHAERGVRDGGDTYADYLDWRKQGDLFEALALWRPSTFDLASDGRAERVGALFVTGEYFGVLGARTSLGRTFDVSAEQPGDRPVVLADGAWRRIFGADPTVIDRKIFLSGVPYTVAGVLAPGHVWPIEMDVFVPLRLDPARDPTLLRRDNFVFRALARLRPGVSIDHARARLRTLAVNVEGETPTRKGWSYDLVELRAYTVGDQFPRQVLMLSAAAALVLLIACANVANLLLVRGTTRTRDVAVRVALGASRGRIVRALLAEAGILSIAGSALGLAAGYWLSRALVAIAPRDQRLLAALSLDWQTVAFAAIAAAITTLVFALAPALQAGVVAPNAALKDSGRATSGKRSVLLRDLVVGCQVALAVVLLVTATLLVRSLTALGRADIGVDVRNVLGARVIVPGTRYPQPAQRSTFYDALLERVAALPGVRTAALTSRLPAGGPGFGLGRVFLREGQPEPPASSDAPAQWTVVTPAYFDTMGIRLLRGRAFTAQDEAASVPVIIISERLARTLFPGEEPLGRRIRSWRDENKYREIVGIAADVRYFGLTDRPRAAVYVPHRQDPWGTMMLAVKTAGDPSEIVPELRRELNALDPLLALGAGGTREMGTMDRFAAESVSETRFTGSLIAAFAAVALVLATIGVYGVMSYVASRRAREMGLRMALGARPASIRALILGRGLAITTVGIVIGLTGAIAAARALRSSIHEIPPTDPWSFSLAPVVLLGATALACLIPAWIRFRFYVSTELTTRRIVATVSPALGTMNRHSCWRFETRIMSGRLLNRIRRTVVIGWDSVSIVVSLPYLINTGVRCFGRLRAWGTNASVPVPTNKTPPTANRSEVRQLAGNRCE
jgi:putative ABC transport system permease protein